MSNIIIIVVIVVASLVVCYFFRTNMQLHYRCRILETRLIENERTQAVNAIQEEIFQIILDNIPYCIIVKDVDNENRHIIWNKELERQTGVTQEEILGKTDLEIEPWPGMGPFIRQLDEQAIRKGSILQDTYCATRSGKYLYYKTDKRSIVTRNGRKLILDMCRDVTEETELRNSSAEIIEKQRRVLERYEISYDCVDYITKKAIVEGTTDWDAIFTYILSRFGTGENASHVYVYFLSDQGGPFLNFAYEWYNEQFGPIPETLKRVPFDILPKTKQAFLQDHQLIMFETSDLEPAANSFFRDWVQSEQISFAIFAPLTYKGRIIGLLGFNYREFFKERAETSKFIVYNTVKMIELVFAWYRDKQST